MEKALRLTSEDRKATYDLGVAFGRSATGRGTIALIGPLGAGKTCLVQGLAEGLGIDPSSVCSPTYLLVHLHEGRLPLAHVDLYRLNGPAEVAGLGLEETFDAEGICAVEWADKAIAFLPSKRLCIRFDTLEDDRREILITTADSLHRAWIDRVLQSYPALKTKETSGIEE